MAQEFSEAPASITITIKTPKGFEVLFTSRTFDDKELTKSQIAHLLNLENALSASGFTPVVRGFGNKSAPKPVDYVEGRTCPTCGNRLVHKTTKDGRKFIACETNKYDFTLKKAVGCPFTEWPKPENDVPTRDMNDY